MTPPDDITDLLVALPLGASRGIGHGKPCIATRSLLNAGRSTRLVAEELGGTGDISMNDDTLTNGPQLYPCERTATKVIAFLRSYKPAPAP